MVDSPFIANNEKLVDNSTGINDNSGDACGIETDAVEPTIKPHLILALDYGVKKMGMALGNSMTQTARAFDILAMNNGQPDCRAARKRAK